MGGVNSSMGLMLEQSAPLGTLLILSTYMIVTSVDALIDSIKHCVSLSCILLLLECGILY